MMKKIILVIFCLNLIFPNIALAEGGLGTNNENLEVQTGAFIGGSQLNTFTNESSLSEIIATVIQIFLGFLGIIFLVLILVSGFRYMTAQGNEDQINKAVSTIKQAVIGLIIISLAYAITYFVFNNITWSGGGGGSQGGS